MKQKQKRDLFSWPISLIIKNISFETNIKMSIYYNPESTSSQNQNYYQLSKQTLSNCSVIKQNSITNKKPSTQTVPRSVGKFKRTNPTLQNTKPASPFPKKTDTNQLTNSRINYVKSGQLSNHNHQHYRKEFTTNLATSTQTPRTEEGKTIPYVSPSKEPTILINERNSLTRQKFEPQQDDLKSLRSFRSGKSSNKGSKADNQNYSIYWKKKAHQYLETNFRLTEEINDLKKQLEKYQLTFPSDDSVSNSQLKNQTHHEISVPVYIVQMQQKNYLQQITQLEITHRLKDSVIQNLQNKIIQLTQKIKGSDQKSELMQKMRKQIAELEHKNKKLTHEQQKVIKLNKIYETQKALQEVKEKSKPPVQIAFPQFGDYKFQKDLERHRYRSLE